VECWDRVLDGRPRSSQRGLAEDAHTWPITSPYVYRRIVLIPRNRRKIQCSRTKSVLFSPRSVICAHGYKSSLMFETVRHIVTRDADFDSIRQHRLSGTTRNGI
jgi:hypothetical protein